MGRARRLAAMAPSARGPGIGAACRAGGVAKYMTAGAGGQRKNRPRPAGFRRGAPAGGPGGRGTPWKFIMPG